MATTTNFGWETPDDTDLVKDGAAAMRTLGNSIDASFVDLKGGTTNQVLAKNSNTDLDFKWVADASGIPATILDAKGDIIAATAADTADRLAVGTNGQVLTADSTTSTGLKWATPSSTVTYSGVSLYNTTAINVSNGVATALTWNTEEFDTDGYHSTSTNTSRITIPTGKAGKYLVAAFCNTNDNSTTGGRRIYIYKNGTLFKNIIFLPGSTIYPSIGGSVVMDLAVNDYIEFYYEQNSGSSQSVVVNSQYGHFSASFLGA